jgi:hypothetical protein
MSGTKESRRKRDASGKTKSQKRFSGNKAESGNPETETIRRGAISVFILFHLIAITCVAVPLNFPALKAARELVQPYMRWIGLFQTWDMFAPDPEKVNSYVKTVVITRDRRMHVWSFPRMEELSYGERYQKERYRKFVEVLPQQQNFPLWPDVARHVANMFNSQTDPPDKILLIQFQSDIHTGAARSYNPTPRPNIFYEYYVQPGDLQ